jgi:hypothetical protein
MITSATNPERTKFINNAATKAGLMGFGGINFGAQTKSQAPAASVINNNQQPVNNDMIKGATNAGLIGSGGVNFGPPASTVGYKAPPKIESRTPEQMAQDAGNPATGIGSRMPETPQAPTPTPTTGAPDTKTAADTAYESYLKSLESSPEETDATKYLNTLTTQGRLDYEKALQTGETLGFATGEAGNVARTNAILRDSAANNVLALERLRENRGTMSKARYDYEKSKLDKIDKDLAAQKKAEEKSFFELSPGQTRNEYDPVTGKSRQIASLPATPKAVASPKGTTRSGGLEYTPEAAAEDTQELEVSRGTDEHVDSALYKRLYNEWYGNGGLLKDFLLKFPPDKYVNPDDKSLPSYLKPKSTKTEKEKLKDDTGFL